MYGIFDARICGFGPMLKKRIIPKLLIKNRVLANRVRPLLVTTRGFQEIIEVGDPVFQAKIYEAQLADELIVLNIESAPLQNDVAMLDLITRLASETFMPLAVGGGVQSLHDFELLLERGADKVCINSAALNSPHVISEAARRFGSQCVVVSIDFRTNPDGHVRVMRKRAMIDTQKDLLAWASEVVDRGAGEILITDADRDGACVGINWQVARNVVESVQVPVIISGGCGKAEHFIDGFLKAGVEGVAAGTYFCFRDQNPIQTRAQVRNAGVPIRMGE